MVWRRRSAERASAKKEKNGINEEERIVEANVPDERIVHIVEESDVEDNGDNVGETNVGVRRLGSRQKTDTSVWALKIINPEI